MKNFKSHFVFNKSQRNGIFLLMALIFCAFAIFVWFSFKSTAQISSAERQTVLDLQKKIDSLKQIKAEPKQPKIYPFNPNFITDYKGYKLGMSVEEIDRLLRYRAQDKWINSKEDFQAVTRVSDSLLAKISPYFDFPDWVTKTRNHAYKNHNKAVEKTVPFHLKKDLNTATRSDLEKIDGIGKTLSQRILRYRIKLGGFVSDLQLKDIYGLNYEATQKLTSQFTVKDTTRVKKISINQATLAQLSEIVYFDYELARDIVEYRTLHEGINTFEELAKIDNFPAHQIDRIKLYLTLQ